jgi:hypothetical protein
MKQIKTKEELIEFLQLAHSKNPESENRIYWMTETTECSVQINRIPDFIQNKVKPGFPKYLKAFEGRINYRHVLKYNQLAWDYKDLASWQAMTEMTRANLEQAQKDQCQWLIDLFNNDLYLLGTEERAREIVKEHQAIEREKKQLEHDIAGAEWLGVEVKRERHGYVKLDETSICFEEIEELEQFAAAVYRYYQGKNDALQLADDMENYIEYNSQVLSKYTSKRTGDLRRGLSCNQLFRLGNIREKISEYKDKLAMLEQVTKIHKAA